MRNTSATLLMLVGGLTVSPLALAAEDFDTLMGLLAKRQHGHVSFTEKHELSVLDKPLESSGELLYDAPDHLEKRTLKPRPESLVLEKGIVTAQRGRHTYTLNLADYPQVVPLIDSIRATLAGDRAALEKVFKIDFHGNLERWTLGLIPLDANVTRSVREILIEGRSEAIHTVTIQQADGDRSVLTIGPQMAPP